MHIAFDDRLWPRSRGKNAWRDEPMSNTHLCGCHHMYSPSLEVVLLACWVCIHTLFTIILKRICLLDLEMGNMIEGAVLQNMDYWLTSHGHSSWKLTLSQMTT